MMTTNNWPQETIQNIARSFLKLFCLASPQQQNEILPDLPLGHYGKRVAILLETPRKSVEENNLCPPPPTPSHASYVLATPEHMKTIRKSRSEQTLSSAAELIQPGRSLSAPFERPSREHAIANTSNGCSPAVVPFLQSNQSAIEQLTLSTSYLSAVEQERVMGRSDREGLFSR